MVNPIFVFLFLFDFVPGVGAGIVHWFTGGVYALPAKKTAGVLNGFSFKAIMSAYKSGYRVASVHRTGGVVRMIMLK